MVPRSLKTDLWGERYDSFMKAYFSENENKNNYEFYLKISKTRNDDRLIANPEALKIKTIDLVQ